MNVESIGLGKALQVDQTSTKNTENLKTLPPNCLENVGPSMSQCHNPIGLYSLLQEHLSSFLI
jgi:hypothetical protein